jgi:hypothetical protein
MARTQDAGASSCCSSLHMRLHVTWLTVVDRTVWIVLCLFSLKWDTHQN